MGRMPGSGVALFMSLDAITQKYFEMLLRTQFLPPDKMLAYQRSLCEPLIRHARANVPFYRDGRLDVLFGPDDRIDWERWGDVPVLTRKQAQDNVQALYAESIPPECGGVVTGYTAGSTGTPLAYRTNQVLAAAGSATLERGLMWAGLPPDLTTAELRNDRQSTAAFPDGATYQSVIRGAQRMMHHLALQTTIEQQGLSGLKGIRPDVVISYPGALAVLAQNLPAELEAHRFQLAICVGEVTTEQARTLKDRGRLRLPRRVDLYSGSEFGTVAIRGP